MQQAAQIHCVFIILCWSFKLCSTSPSAPGSPPSRACFHSFMFSILFSSFHFFFDDPPHHPYLSLSPLLLLLLIFLSPHVSFFLLPPYFSPFASFYFLSLVSLCGSKRCFFAWFYWTHLSASLSSPYVCLSLISSLFLLFTCFLSLPLLSSLLCLALVRLPIPLFSLLLPLPSHLIAFCPSPPSFIFCPLYLLLFLSLHPSSFLLHFSCTISSSSPPPPHRVHAMVCFCLLPVSLAS